MIISNKEKIEGVFMYKKWFYGLGIGVALTFGGCGNSHAPVSDTDVANKFVQSLRTQVSGIVDLDKNGTQSAFLDMEAEKWTRQLKDVVLNASLAGKYVAALLDTIGTAQENDTEQGVKENVEQGRTVHVTYQAVPKPHWEYRITVASGNPTPWEGNVTLPQNLSSDTIKSLQPGQKLALTISGKVPLYKAEEHKPGAQDLDLAVEIEQKTANIRRYTLQNLALQNGNAYAKISDLQFNLNQTNGKNIVTLTGLKLAMHAGDFRYNGQLRVTEYQENSTYDKNEGLLPSKMIFEGKLEDSAKQASIDGNFSVDWLDAKTVDLQSSEEGHYKMTLSGLLKRSQLPDTQVTLTYNDPLMGSAKTIIFDYAYDQTHVTAKGVFDKAMENGTIDFSANDGITAQVKVVNGDVVYGTDSYIARYGKKIGHLEKRSGVPVIVYKDGTFESLQ